MLLHKRFYSFTMVFLVVFSATDSFCAPLARQRVQKKSVKSIFNKKFTQIKQFICKHQTAFATVGAAGVLVLIAYLAPEAKAYPQQLNQLPVRPLDRYPVFDREVIVGASPCAVHEVVLQPGVQQGNWNPHLVDGYTGAYALRERATNNVIFVADKRLASRYQDAVLEHNPIAIRFRLDAPISVRQLQVVRQEGDTCAYHALKNCQLILDEFQNPRGDLVERLADQGVAHDRIDLWQNHILIHHRDRCSVQNGRRAGEWLHPEGLQALVNLEHENHRITVVDAGRFQERLAQNPLALARPFDFDAQNPAADFVHGFVVQDRAHWLSAVVRRIRGQIEWWIVDSNNQPAFNRAGLMHLLARLHGRAA